MKKRVFSFFMAVALLLGSVSVTGNVAFAEDSPDSSVQIGDYYLSEDSKITDTTVTSTEKSYSDGMVKINKTIAGTDKENEFDITLKVQTGLEVATHTRGANVAVVLVIDSSTSMRDNMDPDKQRLYAAKQAAQNFVNAYADANASGNRFLSIVSYNTDAHVMQGWIDLGTSAGAAEVRNSGGYIKDQADYQSYYFSSPIYRDEKYWAPIAKIETQKGTNLDGGLLLAANLLQDNTTLSGVDNKVIILLSDGTPTTHVVEEDRVKVISGGEIQSYKNIETLPSYTHNENQITRSTHLNHAYAEQDISAIKNMSPSVDMYSVYVGTNETKCGDGDDSCYIHKNLKGGYGPSGAEWLAHFGVPTESADTSAELIAKFESFVDTIEKRASVWDLADPMGINIAGSSAKTDLVQFCSFLDSDGKAIMDGDAPALSYSQKGASYNDPKISWDIRKSDFSEETDPSDVNKKIYTYTLKYKVRLNTLDDDFDKSEIYKTNDVTSVDYYLEEGTSVVKSGTAEFNIPSVKGFAADLTFKKTDDSASKTPLSGAEFTLTSVLDKDSSGKKYVQTASSDASGNVAFKNIPSGFEYKLVETEAPSGFIKSTKEYKVVVSYGKITIYDGTTVVYQSDAGDGNPSPAVFSVENAVIPTDPTYRLDYHVIGDPEYGIPADSTTPASVTDIASGDDVTLVDADGTVTTSQTYAEIDGKQIPGTWTFVEHWTEDGSDPDKADITTDKVTNITEDKDVYGQWAFTPDTYTLEYHVIGDPTYGTPADSKTPEKVTGIPYDGEVDLKDADGTVATSQTYAEVDGKQIPGSWTFVEYWTEDGSDPDKADITSDKVSNITENKDVYGQWVFTPGTYTLEYHVIGDPTYGTPADSKTPEKVTAIPYDGEVDLKDADGTVTTSQTYAEVDGKQIPGTWTFVEYWTEDGGDPDKADITTDKVSNITENKDVYGQWKFVPDPEDPPVPPTPPTPPEPPEEPTYIVIYIVEPDPVYGVPDDSVTPKDPTDYYYKDDVKVKDDLTTTDDDGVNKDTGETEKGTWEFTPWDMDDFQITHDTEIHGKWVFTPDVVEEPEEPLGGHETPEEPEKPEEPPVKPEPKPEPIPGKKGSVDWDGDGMITELDDIFDGDVPLGGIDWNGDGYVNELDDLFDDEPPLANVSVTGGDVCMIWILAAAASGIVLCALLNKKRYKGKHYAK